MCGIFGEFGSHLLDKNHFLKLNKLSEKRGPNMNGYWTNEKFCQLGFNRLSIIDLTENGNQPMLSQDKRWAMVMNGEVYNYHEIRKKLGCSLSNFQSQTDSEVVLMAFQIWGINKTLDILNGIFALALLDVQNKKIHLIRDFAGVKPLYYGYMDDCIIFSSQYDQIFNHPCFKYSKTPNLESLYDYTRFGYIPAPNAFFKNTWQVEPGQVVSFDSNLSKSIRKYYNFLVTDQDQRESDPKTLEKLDNRLRDTMRRQIMSDVPIGSFLSGGIDSPLISSYVHKINSSMETFTIGSDNPYFDETESAVSFAKSMDVINHLHYYSDKTLTQDINEHFKAFSEPFGDYSSLPTFQVCKMAKAHFSVILGGDGGDEIFWGYPRFHKIASHFPWFNWGLTTRKYAGFMGRKMGFDISYGIHAYTIGEWLIERHSHNNCQTLRNLLPGLSNSKFMQKLYFSPERFKNKTELLNWLRWNEFYGHLQRVLMKVDRASMYHGLEVRVPFLDRSILNYSKKIKPELSITHNTPKLLLRELLKKNFSSLPINENKMGFSIDIDNSLRTVLKEEVCDLLIGQDPYPKNTFDLDNLEKHVNSYYKDNNGNEWGIWILYAMQKWAKSFGVIN